MTDEHRSPDPDRQTGGVTIGDVEGGIHGSTIAGRDVTIGQKITNFFLGSTTEQRALRNRRAMLELVRNTWVKGVLEQSLHGAVMIELGMEEQADAVEHPWDMVLQMSDRPSHMLPPGTKIVDVFDKVNRSLLVLGEPGSGKTTTLLELTRDTIARAEEDPAQPIPVVFKLSSWMERRRSIAKRLLDYLFRGYLGPFAEWLLDELNTKYQIPERIARPWIENDDLLLLLDGLDEVSEKHRDACVKAINEFCQKYMVILVICSRTADYQALTAQLKFQGAVLLQPLTAEQIERYLTGTGTDLLAVRDTLKHDTTLQELAQTPLMLSVMTLAYRGMSTKELGKLDTVEARRRHLFDVYVRRMFERRSIDQPYSPRQVICWLAWLAYRMSYHSKLAFWVEEMQPSFLDTKAQRRLHTIAWCALSGPIMGLALGLVAGLAFNPPTRILPVGLVGGFTAGLFLGLIAAPARIEPVGPLGWLLPEHGIRRSLRIASVAGLVGGLIGALVFGMGAGPIAGSYFGLSVGLVLMLYLGGFAVIQHVTLRFILYLSGCVPWNLARFLDYAAERIFLRKVGGGYIFIHRLLQDYFASLYQEQ